MQLKEQPDLKPQDPSPAVDYREDGECAKYPIQTSIEDFPCHRTDEHHSCSSVVNGRSEIFLELRTRCNKQHRETGEEHQEVKPLTRLHPRDEDERCHNDEAHTELPSVLDVIERLAQRLGQAVMNEVHGAIPNKHGKAQTKAPQHACSRSSRCCLCLASPAGRSPE